jgi:hypothetical protein
MTNGGPSGRQARRIIFNPARRAALLTDSELVRAFGKAFAVCELTRESVGRKTI